MSVCVCYYYTILNYININIFKYFISACLLWGFSSTVCELGHLTRAYIQYILDYIHWCVYIVSSLLLDDGRPDVPEAGLRTSRVPFPTAPGAETRWEHLEDLASPET